jgi:hypothetical protein
VEEAYKLEGIKEIVFTKKLGDTVTQIQSSTDRVGYVVAQNVGAGEAITTCEKAISEIKLLIKC